MKITRIEVYALRAPTQERPHWTSHFIVPTANEILVQLWTDEGIDGFGLATSYTPIDFAVRAFQAGLGELVVGEDPLAPERLYAKLFGLTSKRVASERGWSREALIRISAAVDIACWDIVGKAAGLPLYRLFGGYRSQVPAYVTCAYYREGKDLAELRDEMEMLKAQGHTGFKAKFGGAPLAEDVERLALMREVIGPDRSLMVDVNRAWDLDTAIEGARLIEPLDPLWLEEPLTWEDDRRGLKLLAMKTRIPLSGGESETTSYGCRAMLEEQAIQILQFDCTMMGGFTEGRKLAALCDLNHVKVAPHHDCFIHAHIVAGSPSGYIVESFTDPERDPLQAELFEDPPTLRDGMLTLKEQPGLGLTLSERAMTKFSTRIL
ncbi:mandelate racemase/muconate lactonizing enzyme family protein [Methylobacterium sp. NEAU 140]|uniref:mandelate racemase/muconate lactonizing enzyme family protein n=1 Tax=Methylobacterium sp. NEAU 140 TaxID=3064945 RepID=UPI002734962D|nr:mandelate racemase/muconate lactonizing enzyme family protein [Methylobacterium sp. NEAU 140]MDP4026889.1 mandelate racemase/muconate lactonizing enzyme family protein [Methylobacterium sp. NEAU 140]